jgi:predicted PurR-regulated permease PerM
LEIIFEIVFGFFAEIFIQVLAEALFELGFYSLAETLNRKRRRNPFLASIGYLIWGGIIGGVTIFVFPTLMIKNPTLRLLNLIISPIIAGLAMSALGSWRKKRGQDTLRIDSFIYGALFAFGLAIVRFLYEIYGR